MSLGVVRLTAVVGLGAVALHVVECLGCASSVECVVQVLQLSLPWARLLLVPVCLFEPVVVWGERGEW